MGTLGVTSPGTASPDDASALTRNALAHSPELSETRRLEDRRALVIGTRLYATSTEDGLYPAMGFHTRGEMGGVWSPPVKLLDGMWFGIDGAWLGSDVPARRFVSGWGYHRIEYAAQGGLTVERTDVVPDAFDVVVPSLPGSVFSSPSPAGIGWRETARLWVRLMAELGYEQFGAHGGDSGGYVSASSPTSSPSTSSART